ncbi:MAG: c-type cytochrome biogenesis protein CcmI [Paracoccaceae bacterium]|nr:c-type cytochrome biogenesis protein CcmI [Paracoccaceae bacterium]
MLVTFWLISGALGALVALTLALAFRRGGRAGLEAAESDLLVYREQLSEIDRDVARGVLSEAEAEAVRLEVKRRLLAADRKAGSEAAISGGPARLPAAVTALAVLGGAVALYWTIGAPGYPDLPLERRIAEVEAARDARPGQAQAEAALRQPDLSAVEPEFLRLMDELRTALETRPDDLQGHRLLAANEARLGRFAAARAAQERVLAILGENATADDWADLVDTMVLAAGGYVSPEAERAIGEALARDPENGPARYYLGLGEAQVGRADRAFRVWSGLLADSLPGDPWLPVVRAEIEGLAALAGVPFSLETAPGPDAGDLAAAAELSAEERAAMVEGMVEGLAARLASEGGPPEDWARLIAALNVLGQRARAEAIAAEARTVFSADIEAVGMIERALGRAGGEP